MHEVTDTRAVRAWLRQNGMPISDRGRIPSELIARYEKAHGIVRIPADRGRKLPLVPNGRGGSLLIRTDFSDDAAWYAVLDATEALTREGFKAFVEPCEDRAFADLTPAELMDHLPNGHRHQVLFLVDTLTLRHPEHPLLALSVNEHEADSLGAVFRAIPSAVQAVSDNLSIANLSFREFASGVDPDGILRLY